MNKTYAQYINKNLKKLVDYINYLVDFSKKYNNALKELYSKSENNNIKKSENIIKYEQQIKESYDKAKNLYDDLKRIAQNYKLGMNIDNDIKWFHNKLSGTTFPQYNQVTLRLKMEKQDLKNGVPTGGASALQNVQDMYTRNINHEKEEFDKLTNSINQIPNAVGDFLKNYNDMKQANTIGADKYFHAKANAEASQRGFLGELTASTISNLREITDTFKNTLLKGMTLKDSLKDSKEDLEANKFGRTQGRKNPHESSKELVNKYRPNGLPQNY